MLFFLYGCKSSRGPVTPIPVTSQFKASYALIDGEHQLELKNYLKAPVRFFLSVPDIEINSRLKDLQPLVLKPEQDTLIHISAEGYPHLQPVFHVGYGNPEKPVVHSPVSLPVSRNKPVRILQGHDGSYSHNDKVSRYAIDFKLNIGDTVYSASKGFVVQVIESYKYGGKDLRWKDMANKIVVYDPETGRFFQYSHLVQNGSFVKQGDTVKQGQPIGLSGNTGFSDTPHLHFVVLIPDDSTPGMRSVPVDFMDGFKGEDFRKNSLLPKKNRQGS